MLPDYTDLGTMRTVIFAQLDVIDRWFLFGLACWFVVWGVLIIKSYSKTP